MGNHSMGHATCEVPRLDSGQNVVLPVMYHQSYCLRWKWITMPSESNCYMQGMQNLPESQIGKSRGSTKDGIGVHDSIVTAPNKDGVESLNNVLLLGMTNRKDLLDEALLRPGRSEVQVEISLLDEIGCLQILQIYINKMKENSFLASDVNLQELGYSQRIAG